MNNHLLSRPPLGHTVPGSNSGTSTSTLRYHVKAEPEDDSDIIFLHRRPAKRPRTSLDLSVQTPKVSKMDPSLSRRVLSTGQVAKEKKRIQNDENTPIGKVAPATQIQTRLEDYTNFKDHAHVREKERYTHLRLPCESAVELIMPLNLVL
jgi:hypothetical protein